MIIAITGTPGTGKTSVSEILQSKSFKVIDLNKVACEKDFLIERDEERDSEIVDINKFNDYVNSNYRQEDLIFIEGHLSHLLKSVDKVILLRCHPNQLKKNLSNKGWGEKKIKENLEAEILDIILCESVEIHSEDNIFEIDTTNKSINDIISSILEIINNKFKSMTKYNI
ncbi:adenylate kinase family protein, partial [Candidatus Woesearchaeota archaeon]|nr:adenylate kinase family protein [Candidatus Woesearchaeota archaeon]